MALTFIREWYIVYGAARRIEKMQDLVEAWGHALILDVTDDEQMQDAVKKIIWAQWKIDVLINNAWFSMSGAIEEVSIDDARYQFEVNVFGLARVTQLVIPYMREQKSWTIINISSIWGKMTFPFGGRYHATKHSVEALSDALRTELADFWIHVVVIEPWLIKTEFGDAVHHHMWEKYADGPYAKWNTLYQDAIKKNYENNGDASPPSVITDVVRKAILSPKPKTRYHAWKFSTTLLFMRRILWDRLFDKIALSMFK